MKLYYKKGACSLVVRIILNELNITFTANEVDLKNKTYQDGLNFKEINPKGAVPVLELEKGIILTENAVILQYLADTNPEKSLLPAQNNFARYKVLEWLNFITTELHKGFGPLFHPQIPEEIKNEIFKPLLQQKFNAINQHLQTHSTFHNNQFTLPDAYLYVMMRWALGLKIDLSELTHLTRYTQQLEQHTSIKKSLQEEELMTLF